VLDQLAVTARDISNLDDAPARLSIDGIVGGNSSINLDGKLGLFGEQLFLDVSGELRDFSVPSANPYLRRFLDWIARRGDVTTHVHYRVDGKELTATNRIVVRRLDVQRAGDMERSERLVGIPLGLAVALLKDSRGTIELTVPVSGRLDALHFSFGNTLRTAFKNVIGRLISAPFRAIGSVLRRGGAVRRVAIEPVTFPEGSAVLTADATAHVQDVARFLRDKPYVRLTLEAVLSADDMQTLRAQAVVARILRLQRENRLGDFAEAARRLWSRVPDHPPVPNSAQQIVQHLAVREPAPNEAARRLAQQRLETTRHELIERAGIAPDRVQKGEREPLSGAASRGRVEFEVHSAS
jgi:hypothetical protein